MKNVDRNLDVIKRNPREILHGDDNCVLRLLDSLTNKFIIKNDIKYIEALDFICRVAVGYVGEYFEAVCEELFYQNFKGLFQYLYANQKNDTCFEKLLVWEVSDEINSAADREQKKQEIDNYLNEQTIKLRLSESEIEYLKKLQSKFDAAIWD